MPFRKIVQHAPISSKLRKNSDRMRFEAHLHNELAETVLRFSTDFYLSRTVIFGNNFRPRQYSIHSSIGYCCVVYLAGMADGKIYRYSVYKCTALCFIRFKFRLFISSFVFAWVSAWWRILSAVSFCVCAIFFLVVSLVYWCVLCVCFFLLCFSNNFNWFFWLIDYTLFIYSRFVCMCVCEKNQSCLEMTKNKDETKTFRKMLLLYSLAYWLNRVVEFFFVQLLLCF